MDYPTLIDRLTDRFRRDDRALGLWLADSRGRGEADAHGDVDTVHAPNPTGYRACATTSQPWWRRSPRPSTANS